jgi:SMI1-KNR4 cell-wall
MLKSKYKQSIKNFELLEIFIKKQQINSNEYLNFLKENNVVILNSNHGITVNNAIIPIDIIFGYSKKEDENLIAIHDSYKHRIPDDYIAIASANWGDFICLSIKGEVFHWDHEVHDLYFNMDGEIDNTKGSYKPQNVKLNFIANSFIGFLELIKPAEESDDDDDDSLDEYEDTKIPFHDEGLTNYFKNPKLFLTNSPNRISIYLKKLELSDKGRQLLSVLKQEGLIK